MADYDVTTKSVPTLAGLLFVHIVQKGWQLGSVLGVGIVAPAVYLLKGRPANPMDLLAKSVAYTGVALTGASGVLGAVKISSIDRAGLEDRVYRLHFNEGQNRTDVFTAVGVVVGLAAAAALAPKPLKPLLVLGGASAGSAAGVALHWLTRPAPEPKHVNVMLDELRHKK